MYSLATRSRGLEYTKNRQIKKIKLSFLKDVMVHTTIILKYTLNAVKDTPLSHFTFHFSEGFHKALVKSTH